MFHTRWPDFAKGLDPEFARQARAPECKTLSFFNRLHNFINLIKSNTFLRVYLGQLNPGQRATPGFFPGRQSVTVLQVGGCLMLYTNKPQKGNQVAANYIVTSLATASN